MLKVLLLRANAVNPDPRVEKEVNSLLKMDQVSIQVLAWNRSSDNRYQQDVLELPAGKAVIHRIGVRAGWGVGPKANLIPFIKYVWFTFLWLVRNLKQYDCVHLCDLHTAVPALIPIMLYHKKVVYDIYDYLADTINSSAFLKKIIRFAENQVINHAEATIICSEKRREQIAGSIPKKLVIIHNAPSDEQFKNVVQDKVNDRNNLFCLVYVGNLVDDRCIRLLIESVEKMDGVMLRIGGMGALTDFVKQHAQSSTNIIFQGKLEYHEVLSLEAQADALIAFYDPRVPNHKFAAPNKFYEALALGKPLIMFHNTGVDDVVDQYGIGRTCEPNIQSVQEAISNLKNSSVNQHERSQKEKTLFHDRYSWNIMEERLIRLYTSIQEEMMK